MITITKDNEFTTVEELRQGLLDVIKTELEEYSPDDTGWTNYSVDEIYTLVDRYLNEVTDAEIDEYNEDCGYEDRDEAIMCYINEWAF